MPYILVKGLFIVIDVPGPQSVWVYGSVYGKFYAEDSQWAKMLLE